MAISLSPLVADPGYAHTTNFLPNGRTQKGSQCRVRPEASAIAKQQSQGTIARLLQEGGDFPPPSHRKYSQPKNHSRANQERIRDLAERGRRKREEVDKSLTPVTSTGKYSRVPSKVDTNLELQSRPKTVPQAPPTRHAPRSSSASFSSKDYLAVNIRAASQQSVKQDPKQEALVEVQRKREEDFSHHKRGKLPQYLVSRRVQWKKAEEERLANRPDPSIPPGHRLMANQERQHTLDVLSQHKSTLTQELRYLPLRTDTLKHKLRRAELENKLTEIDDALKIFSRPKVLVKIDD